MSEQAKAGKPSLADIAYYTEREGFRIEEDQQRWVRHGLNSRVNEAEMFRARCFRDAARLVRVIDNDEGLKRQLRSAFERAIAGGWV